MNYLLIRSFVENCWLRSTSMIETQISMDLGINFYTTCPECKSPGPHHTTFVKVDPRRISFIPVWQQIDQSIDWECYGKSHYKRSCAICFYDWTTLKQAATLAR